MKPNVVLFFFKESVNINNSGLTSIGGDHSNDTNKSLSQYQNEDEPTLLFILALSVILTFIDLTTFTGNLLVVISVSIKMR